MLRRSLRYHVSIAIVICSTFGFGCLVAVAAQTPVSTEQPALSHYDLDLVFNPSESTIGGRQIVEYINDTGQVQASIPFRLYPNAEHYGEGALRVAAVVADGVRVELLWDATETILFVPLEAPLTVDGTVEIQLDFTASTPVDSEGSAGIFTEDSALAAWVLADFYPIVAGWEADRGWVLDPPTEMGDPTFSAAATYDVSVVAPAELDFIATGAESTTGQSEGHRTWHFYSGAAREFVMVAGVNVNSLVLSPGKTTVTVHLTAGDSEMRTQAASAIGVWAAESLASNSERFGNYPYDSLDIVEVDLQRGALGVSWAGVIFLDTGLIEKWIIEPDARQSIRLAVAHEVVHQWLGNVVGGNTNDHAFFIEGLTHYLALVAITDANRFVDHRSLVAQELAAPYLRMLEEQGDSVADQPGTEMPAGSAYSRLIYNKSGLGFYAIRREIGSDAFFGAVDLLATRYWFLAAEPDDLLALFEETSGVELDALWSFWFQSDDVTTADVEALVAP